MQGNLRPDHQSAINTQFENILGGLDMIDQEIINVALELTDDQKFQEKSLFNDPLLDMAKMVENLSKSAKTRYVLWMFLSFVKMGDKKL